MNKKVIIVISGRKEAGKNTLANFIAAMHLGGRVEGNGVMHEGWNRAVCLETGLADEIDIATCGVRIMAFATPLKEFCIKNLGLRREQCYGTNAQKNQLTWVTWDGLPMRVRLKHRKRWWHWPRMGTMTGREVMQIFGTEVIRNWCPDAWAHAGYTMAKECSEKLVIITDGRFPNEINVGGGFADENTDVYYIRLLRNVNPEDKHPSETALDHFPLHRFDMIVPSIATEQEMFGIARNVVWNWLKEAGLQ